MVSRFDERIVREAMAESWSVETAKQWMLETPSAGQCNVTAVLIDARNG